MNGQWWHAQVYHLNRHTRLASVYTDLEQVKCVMKQSAKHEFDRGTHMTEMSGMHGDAQPTLRHKP